MIRAALIAITLPAAAPLLAQAIQLEWRPQQVVVGIAAGKPHFLAMPGAGAESIKSNKAHRALIDTAIVDLLGGRIAQNKALDVRGLTVSKGQSAIPASAQQVRAALAGCIPLDTADLARDEAGKIDYFVTPMNCRNPGYSRAYIASGVGTESGRIGSFVVNIPG